MAIFAPFDARFKNVSTLIVKVTQRCNLDCAYCYENVSPTGHDMPIETFKNLVDLVMQHSQSDSILFLFHGGEPTLLSNDWYEEGIEYALKQGLRYNKTPQFSMQTNLLRLSSDKIELFRKYGIQLGISLDGPASLQSTMRGGENRVFKNYLRAKEKGIRMGVLVTINPSNYDSFFPICQWLVDEAGLRRFKANVVTPVGRGHGTPLMKANHIFEAQRAIMEYMIQTNGQLLENNIMVELERFFGPPSGQERTLTLCHEKECGAGQRVLGVTPQGNLLPCGRFQWDDDPYFLSNIDQKHSWWQNRKFNKKVEKFHQSVPESWYDCEKCAAKEVCGYGCQAFIVRSEQQANVDCLPTKMRYAFYKENEERLRPIYDRFINRRFDKKRPHPTTFKIKQSDGSYKVYEADF